MSRMQEPPALEAARTRRRLVWAGAAAALLALAEGALLLAGRADALGRFATVQPAQVALHGILATAALAAGLAPLGHDPARRAAAALATAWLALAALGWLSPGLFGYPARAGWPIRLDLGENLAHLALGLWSARAASSAGEAA